MKRLLYILLLLISVPGAGQTLADTVKLGEVFVTSARQVTDRAIYVRNIDSLVLVNAKQSDLSDLLQKHSSLYIKSYGVGGLSTASFRGTSASHTQVMWNGLNVNSPLWGQTDLSLLPVFFTDEVSLFYGSSSLLKTSGGLGGCISLNNIPEWNSGKQIAFSQSAGSFGYQLSQLKTGFSGKKFVSNTRVFYEKAKNNFRYYDDASGLFDYTRQKNAGYVKNGLLQEFYYKIGSRQFTGLKVMSNWGDRNLPPIMSFRGASRYENQKDHLLSIIGEWKYYGSRSSLSVNSGYTRNALEYFLSNSTPESVFVNYDTESVSNVLANKADYRLNFSERTSFKSSLDVQLTKARYTDIKENEGFDVQQSDISLQSSLHHAFNSGFSGYMLAQPKILDGELMPFIAAAGLEYHLTPTREYTIRTNLGRNLHVPNLNDKYFNPGGNKDLLPEIGYQADMGIQVNRNWGEIRYQLEVTGFAALIDNWILWHPSEFRYWTADNVQRVFSRGAEINTQVKGNTAYFKYQVKGNYAYTRTTNQEKESAAYGMQLIYIPRHVGNLQVFLEKQSYSLFWTLHNTGSRYASTLEDRMHRISSHFLMDLGAGKTITFKKQSLDINFRLKNVMNTKYQIIDQRAMPGRNFLISVSYKFSPVSGTATE
jgi:iron complex outermembrane receptor protein